jgi:hypothetical protein
MPVKSLAKLRWILGTAALLACNSPTSADARQLRAVAAASTVTIENPNDWPVFYLLANPQWLALVDLAVCNDPTSSCPRVPGHGTVHVAYGSIAGYQAGETEATLWQWRLERQADGSYQSKDFQAIPVTLH